MTRRLLSALMCAVLAAITPVGVVGAHTLAKDGKISAFLHIEPDDKPLPGKVNTIHFYFNDQDFRFSMEGCLCNASVKEDKKTLFKGDLAAEDIRVGKLNVLLPDNNKSYDVVVSGTPKTAGYFQPFNLKFDIDVGNPPPEPPARRNVWPVVIAGLLVIGLGSIGYYTFGKRAKIRLRKEE
jgi:hypothetical protein